MAKHHSKQVPFPSKEEILAFIGDKPGQIGTREIARAFNLKNDRRVELKRLLRELADEGRIESKTQEAASPRRPALHHARRHHRPRPRWRTDRHADRVGRGRTRRGADDPHRHAAQGPGPAKSPASATARCCASRTTDDEDAARYSGRVIKIIDKAKVRALGIFRALPTGGGRLVPIDKKQLGKELAIPQGATKDAQDGDLIAVSVAAAQPPRAADRPRRGAAWLDQERTRDQPYRHPCPRHPACLPGRGGGRGPRGASPPTCQGREDWRKLALVTIDPVDAKDHDDAVHAVPDPDPDNPGGHILTVAIADVAHYVMPGSALDREALKRGNSVYFPDRVVPMLPERISNDLCSLRGGEDRAALAVRMIIGNDGRKQSHTFHRVLMRSAAKLNYQQAQAAISGRADEVTGPAAR